ncbi:MAG TPA: tetratricopeptide repeat protein, partial [Pyrinomonadaceae bacterium]|nr:tetratricopeptide repeat protein [Pyrinomonadaceae bacterium]
TEGDDAEMFRTIYHEYTHFVVNTNFGKSKVPTWFNEGLAEYYSTFQVVDDQKINLGLAQENHIYLLRDSKFIPLEQLFRVTGRDLTVQGDHSRTIFYAESWALIHYLIQGGKSDGLGKFLAGVIKGEPQDQAFQEAFQMNYAQMESELRKYVGKNTYQYLTVTLKNKLDFDADMQTSPYTEAETNARLGDLLYHTNRADEAEPFLLTALKLDPNLSTANTTLGMVKMRQRKFDEAKQYLEKATVGDQKNHLAFYNYAFLLSREGRDEFGYVRQFPKETADKMRQALKQAIAIAPNFTESYELLAFVALVNNDQLDEAVTMLQRALRMQPGNERYAMRLAELYMRQDKFDEAAAITAKFAQSDDDDVRGRAEHLASEIAARKDFRQQMTAMQTQRQAAASGDDPTGPVLRRRDGSQPTEEEIAKAGEEANLRFINGALRETQTGEKRVLGSIDKVVCKGSAISYIVKTDAGPLTLTSKDFQSLMLNTFTDTGDVSLGCDANLSNLYAVLTFKERSAGAIQGDLVAVEFVPKAFRLMAKEELEKVPTLPPAQKPTEKIMIVSSAGTKTLSGPITPEDIEKQRREMMMAGMRSAIRQPADGQKRELAFLQKVECTNKGVFFNMKTDMTVLRLFNPKPESLPIRVFTPDLGGVQLGCNASVMDFPSVVIYTDKPDAKLKTAGEILSLDFVPKTFTLN